MIEITRSGAFIGIIICILSAIFVCFIIAAAVRAVKKQIERRIKKIDAVSQSQTDGNMALRRHCYEYQSKRYSNVVTFPICDDGSSGLQQADLIPLRAGSGSSLGVNYARSYLRLVIIRGSHAAKRPKNRTFLA